MSVPKGWIAPRRKVPCSGGCGRIISRSSHFDTAVCKGCNNKRRSAAKAPRQRLMQQQARRYRILLAVSPYRSYEELLKAIRVRNPHTREFHFDLSLEKRQAG
jgi:hypothetical protein